MPLWRVPNNQPGTEALVDRLAQLAQKHGSGRLHIGQVPSIAQTRLEELARFIDEHGRSSAAKKKGGRGALSCCP